MIKSKKCSECDRPSFSKGLCKFHQPKKHIKKLDYNTEDLENLSNSNLKKIADYELRNYLLRNATGFGDRVWCPIKKQSYHKDQIHCCHFYDRGIMSLRYDLKNVHLISAVSNTFDAQVQVEGYKSLHHYEYEQFLIKEYNYNVLEYLAEKSKEVKLFYKEDYIEIIKHFRNDCKR